MKPVDQIECIEEHTWAYPREGLNLDELILRIGLPVLAIDRANNRLLISHTKEEM